MLIKTLECGGCKKKLGKSLCKACHPYAGAMLIFSVSFQIDHMPSKRQLGGMTTVYIL